MSTIVIVDSSPGERARLTRGLREHRRFTIVSCATVDEAIEACPSCPAMVIVGATADEATRLSVDVGKIRRAWGQVQLVLAVPDEARLPTLEVGDRLHLMTRPASIPRLSLLLRREAVTSQVDLPRIGLADLIQMAALGGHTVRIACSLAGKDVGTVDVVGGRLVSARDADGRGIEALSRLLGNRVDARVQDLREAPTPDIHFDWQHALFEAMRLADEAPRVRPFEELMREVSAALLERDYARASSALSQAAEQRPNDPLVQVNLERLAKLGYGPKKGDEAG